MSAVSPCYYHSERPAAGNCTECQQPLCLGCQMVVAGKTVCQPCVSAIRARIAGEMAPGDAAAQSLPAPSPPPPYSYAQTTADTTDAAYQPYAPAYNSSAESIGVKHVLGGLGLGFLAGFVGLIAWIAFVYFTGFNLALIAIGIGWLIGIATVKGAGGRGGTVVALLSAIMALIFCGIGVLLFSIGGGGAWHWIFSLFCLVYGVQRAYATPMSADKHW